MTTAVTCDACGVRSPAIELGVDPVQQLRPHGWKIGYNTDGIPFLGCKSCLWHGKQARMQRRHKSPLPHELVVMK